MLWFSCDLDVIVFKLWCGFDVIVIWCDAIVMLLICDCALIVMLLLYDCALTVMWLWCDWDVIVMWLLREYNSYGKDFSEWCDRHYVVDEIWYDNHIMWGHNQYSTENWLWYNLIIVIWSLLNFETVTSQSHHIHITGYFTPFINEKRCLFPKNFLLLVNLRKNFFLGEKKIGS